MIGLPIAPSTFLAVFLLFSCQREKVEPDESVILFPGIARPAKGGGWEVEIHGCIFEPEEDSAWRKSVIDLLRVALGVGDDPDEQLMLERRLRPFLVDNERGKILKVKLCGKTRELGASEPNGHFRGTVRLTDEEVRNELERPGAAKASIGMEAALQKGETRVFRGQVQIVSRAGISVISDIDDTIKVSEVLDRKALLRNTFLKDFKMVEGMPALYRAWAERRTVFHYVTASPWQLYEPLEAFVRDSGFPAGTFHMRPFRLKDSSILDICSSSIDYKTSQIVPLIEASGKRQFVLVGDSGEKDPEIYGAVARKFPGAILAIFIRDVTDEGAKSERIVKAFQDVPGSRWRVFRDSKELASAVSLFTPESP